MANIRSTLQNAMNIRQYFKIAYIFNHRQKIFQNQQKQN